jgi:nicotinate-nucleotide pyrophosphorylase (carboxylating)
MNNNFEQLIKLWFAEDIGDGDHTTLSCIPDTAIGKSQLIIKEKGVLAGVEVAQAIFAAFDPTLKTTVFIQDGAEVNPGDVAFVVEGKYNRYCKPSIMLHIMQRMSGVATLHRICKTARRTKTRVLGHP